MAYKLQKSHMIGDGFFGDIWDASKRGVDTLKTGIVNTVSAVSNVILSKAPRQNLPPYVRKLMVQIGNQPIMDLYVRRDPIQSSLNSALNIISLGQWNNVRQKYQYDKFFHLQLECVLQISDQDNLTKRYTIEKNAVIEIRNASNQTKDTEIIQVPFTTGLTINILLNGAKSLLGSNYYSYDPFTNNCQDFVMALLNGSGLGDASIFQFVKQPIDELIQEVPSWTGKIGRALTDIGGIVDTVYYGQGKSKPMQLFAEQLERLGVNPIVYLSNAKKNARNAGLADNMLSFSTDNKHKLQIPNVDGKIIRFGAVGYKDYILYSLSNDKNADIHRKNYRIRATKIKGIWKDDPYSPNALALAILWPQ